VTGWRAAAGVERAQLRGFAIVGAVIALGYLLGGLLLLAGLDDVRHLTGDVLVYLTMVAGLPMYGDRGDPVRILRSLGARLAATVAPDEVARTLVQTLTGTLRLPWAAVELDREGQWERMAEAGDRSTASQPVTVPLTHAGEQVGHLLVQPRPTSCSASRPSATTSRRCWPSSASVPAPRQWSRPAKPGSAAL
jgi:hypothetical protein